MSHDAELVAKVAKAIDTRPACDHERASYGTPPRVWLNSINCTECDARAVLDALDLPGRERRAKADALREAADEWRAEPYVTLTFSGSLVAVNLNARAAELDPEEGDHE